MTLSRLLNRVFSFESYQEKEALANRSFNTMPEFDPAVPYLARAKPLLKICRARLTSSGMRSSRYTGAGRRRSAIQLIPSYRSRKIQIRISSVAYPPSTPALMYLSHETMNLDATFVDHCSDHQEAMVPSCQPHVGGQSWITYSYRVGHAMNLRNAPRSHLP